MSSALLSLLLLASAPAGDPTAEATTSRTAETGKALDLDQKRLLVFLAGRGAGRFLDTDPGLGGSMQLGIGVRTVRGLFLQLEIGEGVYSAPGESMGTIIGGLRYELRTFDRLRPSAFVGFTHAHQSSLTDFAATPIGTLAGAADSIEHRTGIQGDLLLRIPFPEHWRGALPRFSTVLRTDVGYYFDDVPAPLHLGIGAGISVTF